MLPEQTESRFLRGRKDQMRDVVVERIKGLGGSGINPMTKKVGKEWGGRRAPTI